MLFHRSRLSTAAVEETNYRALASLPQTWCRPWLVLPQNLTSPGVHQLAIFQLDPPDPGVFPAPSCKGLYEGKEVSVVKLCGSPSVLAENCPARGGESLFF